MNLYWVTTADHHEDWFIVASTRVDAARMHEEFEGYENGDAYAEEVLPIPDGIPAEPGWPSQELLLAVGARFLSEDEPRVVEIDGRRYAEGMLDALIREIDDDIFEATWGERPNQTRKTHPSNH